MGDRRRRYSDVLLSFLESNCSEYTWSSPLLAAVKGGRWEEVYTTATFLNTEVSGTEHEFLLRSQLAALILKYPFDYREIGLEQHPEKVALGKFYDAEQKCRRTNRRFAKGHVGGTRFSRLMEEVRLQVDQIMGPLNSDVIGSMLDHCSFGPGSNIGVGGNSTHLGRKFFSETWSVTPSCAGYFKHALTRNGQFYRYLCEKTSKSVRGSSPYYCVDLMAAHRFIEDRLNLIAFNKVSFVSKTAKTHRCIAIEPLGNSFVQSGAEWYLKERLKLFGIDLSDQGWNQLMARFGSLFELLCTMDLSSASDTIATMLVKALTSSEWFSFLNAIRSPCYLDPVTGAQVKYNKFTSMGNGFCFPLQTILFVSIVRAVIKIENPDHRHHTVYGDDIIVPSSVATQVMTALKFFGFVPNKDKTFLKGPFRESCGADWYNGRDVRPVYLDYHLSNDVALRIFHNATLRSPSVADLFSGVRPRLRGMHRGRLLLRPLKQDPGISPGTLSKRIERELMRQLFPFVAVSARDRNKDLSLSYHRMRKELYRPRGLIEAQREDQFQQLLALVDATDDVRSWHAQSQIHTSGEDIWRKPEWYVRANLDGAFDVPYKEFLASGCGVWDRDIQNWRWKEVVFRPVADPKFTGSIAQYWALLLGSPGGELNRRREARARTIVR